MSKVEELLEKYNPDGVPDKLLVECSLIDYGYPFTSSMFTDDSSYIPIIRIRDVKPGKASTYYMGNYSKEYIVKRGDILVGMDGEFNLEKWNDIDSLLNQRVARITEMPSKSTKGYLYHILGPIFKKIEREISGGSVKHLSVKIINSISIPLPHIKVQEEIVKILDSFTNLIDALNEELSLRQKQFEYYREKLLTFDDNTNRYCLKEVFETKNGYTPSTSNKEFWDNGNIPWFRMEDIRQNGRILNDSTLHITRAGVKGNRLFKANSIILATSATIGEHALILVEHLSNQRFTNFYPNEDFDKKVNMKYIYYYMFIIDEWCKSHVNQGGFASVDMDGLFKLSIPIPSLAVQQSIVEKLDAFESLISSLKEEIALRQKQYEYYREKLLTFD